MDSPDYFDEQGLPGSGEAVGTRPRGAMNGASYYQAVEGGERVEFREEGEGRVAVVMEEGEGQWEEPGGEYQHILYTHDQEPFPVSLYVT